MTSKPKKSNRGGPKHANEHTFRKGTTVHRPSGAENRLNKQCKEMLATCFESVGGLPGLVKWVKESPQNRGAFYTRMWVRLVGLDVHIKDEHKNVVYRTLDEINAALGEQGLTLEMLERLCRYEDEQPRLIEHVRVGLAPKPRRCRSMSMPLFCGSGNLTSIAEALRFLAIPVGADEQEFAAGWRAMPSLSPIHRHHILRTISHARPSARQSRCISPFNCSRTIRSIKDIPKPSRMGFFAGGPPLSVQCRMSRPSVARVQVTSTCPLGTDRDPYLVALVASSCRVTAIA